jgi:hypothetical protein
MDFRQDPQFDNITAQLEQSRGLPRGLLSALVGTESTGNPNAVSPAGAHGLTQFMPATAQQYNVNTSDPVDSLRGTADYLQDLTHQYGGNLKAALAHYNGGAANAQYQVDGTVPPASKVSAQNFQTNQNYVNGIVAALPASEVSAANQGMSVDQVNSMVAKLASQGATPVRIVSDLMRNPLTAQLVAQGKAQGDSVDTIVTNLGGEPLAKIKAAQAKVSAQGFFTNLGQGASQAVDDLGQGAKQLGARITGNDAKLATLQQAQREAEADPERQALGNTWGANIGKLGVDAVPYALAAAGTAAAPEIGLPAIAAINAGVGGTQGALTPTTGDGQFGKNVALSAALAAAPIAGVSGAGKVMDMMPAVLGGGAEKVAARTAAADALRAQGLPVNAITLTDAGKNIASHIPDNASITAFREASDKTIAGKVADGLGIGGYTGPIDSEMLNKARPVIKQALDDATNVSVTLPSSLKTDLQGLLSSAKNPLTEGIATNSTVQQAAANLIKATDAGTAVSGRQLQDLASELKAVASNPAASATERQTAGQMVGKVNNVLTTAMTPDQAAAFNAANRQYANLKAVEKMVTASNDTGFVTPRQMLIAVKNGRFKSSFLQGEAPFQELSGAAMDALGPANGKGLADVLGRSMGGHDLTTAMALEPTKALPYWAAKKLASVIAGKALTSENPTVVKLLTGVSGKPGTMNAAQRQYIAQALGGTLASEQN